MYSTIFHLWHEASEMNEHLDDYIIYNIGFLDFIGALHYCMIYRQKAKFPKHWIEVLISCIILQFGGKIIVGLILGQAPSWILTLKSPLAFLLAYFLTFLCPMDLYWNIVASSSLIHPFEHCLEIIAAIEAG